MAEITLLSKPACVQCNATTRALDKQGSEYTKIDMSADLDAYNLATSRGHVQAPVVLIYEDGEIVDEWSGFDADKINKYA